MVLPAARYSLPNLSVPEERRSGQTTLESEERAIVALVRRAWSPPASAFMSTSGRLGRRSRMRVARMLRGTFQGLPCCRRHEHGVLNLGPAQPEDMVVLDDSGDDGSRPSPSGDPQRRCEAPTSCHPTHLTSDPIEQVFAKIEPWVGDAQQRRMRFKLKEGYALVHTIEALCATPVAAIRQ